jgi:hypothetical protein
MRPHGGAVLGKDAVKRQGRGGAELSCAARGWARGRRWRGQRWRGRRCVVREEDEEAADRWGRSASEREHARGSGWMVGLARQRERREGSAERLHARVGRLLGRKGEVRARGGRRPRAWAEFSPAGGRRAFSFSFYFLILISIFVSFSF